MEREQLLLKALAKIKLLGKVVFMWTNFGADHPMNDGSDVLDVLGDIVGVNGSLAAPRALRHRGTGR